MMSSWARRGRRRRPPLPAMQFLPEYRCVEVEAGRGEGVQLRLCDRLESPGADDEQLGEEGEEAQAPLSQPCNSYLSIDA